MTSTTAPKFYTKLCQHGEGSSHGGVGRMVRCTGPHGHAVNTPHGVVRYGPNLVVQIYPPRLWKPAELA